MVHIYFHIREKKIKIIKNMLRTVSAIPMSASSPSKMDQNQQEKSKTLLFNLEKISNAKSNKRKKEREQSSDDDESYADEIEQNEKLLNTPEMEGAAEDDEEEKQLENLVFGSDKFIINNMDKIQNKKESASNKKVELAAQFEEKPAWQDDNDNEM
jgi:hypothetical protein